MATETFVMELILLSREVLVSIDANHAGRFPLRHGSNQKFPTNIVLPKYGVYISLVNIDGAYMPGVSNIGLRPTYSVDYPLSETHIIGYSGDLYGKIVKLHLFDFLREERKFDSPEALTATVKENITQAQDWYNKYFRVS